MVGLLARPSATPSAPLASCLIAPSTDMPARNRQFASPRPLIPPQPCTKGAAWPAPNLHGDSSYDCDAHETSWHPVYNSHRTVLFSQLHHLQGSTAAFTSALSLLSHTPSLPPTASSPAGQHGRLHLGAVPAGRPLHGCCPGIPGGGLRGSRRRAAAGTCGWHATPCRAARCLYIVKCLAGSCGPSSSNAALQIPFGTILLPLPAVPGGCCGGQLGCTGGRRGSGGGSGAQASAAANSPVPVGLSCTCSCVLARLYWSHSMR